MASEPPAEYQSLTIPETGKVRAPAAWVLACLVKLLVVALGVCLFVESWLWLSCVSCWSSGTTPTSADAAPRPPAASPAAWRCAGAAVALAYTLGSLRGSSGPTLSSSSGHLPARGVFVFPCLCSRDEPPSTIRPPKCMTPMHHGRMMNPVDVEIRACNLRTVTRRSTLFQRWFRLTLALVLVSPPPTIIQKRTKSWLG